MARKNGYKVVFEFPTKALAMAFLASTKDVEIAMVATEALRTAVGDRRATIEFEDEALGGKSATTFVRVTKWGGEPVEAE